ncbi:DUF3237 family protein [Clostridium manihotivorum]|uniref:DUF3237 domain-containing protein n=1 Tax=Clostridium manihotivorum TaxID=2320868 RepID=A0A3R5V8W5_9CLOT|nr:DUF3237 family protein [Clostridium manihotivorum]QAA32875.1 DUF3237 domain-containing protein [Clostridium manihotivorum]
MEVEEVLTIHVKIDKTIEMHNEYGDSVLMLSFSGNATGKYFEGEILPGGIDTQIIGKFGDRHTLSARYMLKGKDHTGENCEIFIENNGNENTKYKAGPLRTYPKIITNSKALQFLNYDILIGELVGTNSGVDIKIMRVLNS